MNILHKISYDGHESVVRKPHSNCIMKSVSGEKVSFSDGSDHPITRLVLSIDMNEDYNGYDKAWAGGEGKNLLPQFIMDGTYNGVTFTTNKDGSISSEGTATGAVYVASVRIPLEAGTYYFTGTPAGGSASTYNSHADLYDGTTLLRSLGLDTGDGLSFTISSEEAGKEAEFVLHIAEGVTAPEDTWKFFLCTEDIPFEPYENISTLIPYDQVVLKVNGHYYVQDLPEEFCAGFVDLIAGRIVSSYHTDHTEKAEQTNITPREIHTQPGENKMSMNVPGTIEVIYCVDTKLFVENSIAESACDCTPIPNNITDPQDGQALVYSAESDKWVNAAAKGGAGLEEITWAELKAKRDAGELTPGGQYRITDYICTTTQAESQAVSHPFDIIVVADSESVLNENARAIAKDGDTYYQYADLSAWELKYCIDNDADRFKWADTANGHGVVYYMKDDHNNECPYDFKQIQFKRYPITACTVSSLVGQYTTLQHGGAITGIDEQNPVWCYTFSYDPESTGVMSDPTVLEFNANNVVSGNVIKDYINIQDPNEWTGLEVKWLNDVVLFGNSCVSNTFDNHCNSNTFGNGCYFNTFGNNCRSNTFGDGCIFNTFGNNYNSNTFGNNCSYNTFSDNCTSNTFGDNSSYNTFGNGCYSNTFGDSCYSNTFGNDCYSNTFGNDCYYNTFGDGCYSNTFGDGCNYNTFCNGFNYNTFGNYCSCNTFGISCDYNTFGDYCHANTFGNSCCYIDISAGASSSQPKRYYNVLGGVQGTRNSHISITGTNGNNFVTYVGKNSSGVLKTWVPADQAP